MEGGFGITPSFLRNGVDVPKFAAHPRRQIANGGGSFSIRNISIIRSAVVVTSWFKASSSF